MSLRAAGSLLLVTRLSLSSLVLLGCDSGESDRSDGHEGGASPPPADAGDHARPDAAGAPDAGSDAQVAVRYDAGMMDARAPDARAPVSDATTHSDAASDGSATDASVASGCGASGLLFCEDFEQQALGNVQANARFRPTLRDGTLVVDTLHAVGERALHVHAQGGGFAYLELLKFAPPNNSFFGRMRVWIDVLPTKPDYAHYTLFEVAGMQPGLIRPVGGQYVPDPKGNFLGPGSDQGPTGDWTNWKPSAPFEARKWVCLEWELSAADNAIKVWIDGAPKPDLSVATKKHGGNQVDFVFPTFDKAWFGWWLYQSGTSPASFDLWLDDLALASQRLGC